MKTLIHLIVALMIAAVPAVASAQGTITPPKPTKTTPAKRTPAKKTTPAKPARTTTPAARTSNPARNVLITLNRNEIVDMNEFTSMMVTGKRRFVCITQDTITGKYSLIRDGHRLVSPTDCWIDVKYINPANFDDIVYVYKGSDGIYINVTGTKYGPYEGVDGRYDAGQGHRVGEFYFKQMDKWFRRDANGAITPGEPWGNKAADGNVYHSPNGRHTVKFTDNGQYMIVDNGTKIPFIPSHAKQNDNKVYRCIVTDDGRAIIEGLWHSDGGAWQREGLFWNKGAYPYDAKEKVPCLKTNLLMPKDDFGSYANDPYEGWTLDPKFGATWTGRRYKMKNDFTLNDSSYRHTFMANWKYDYVMIDGNRYGSACPIDAYYDEATNSFVWTALEGQSLVTYTYKL